LILQAWKITRNVKKLNFKLASNCKSTLYRFDTSYRIITMIVKLGSVFREIVLVKKEYISYLTIVKVDAYQDEVKQ